MYTQIGRNIRLIRKALNLSVKRFAEMTGVSQATIVNIEQGHTGLKLETVRKLIAFTNFSVDDISKPDFVLPPDFQKKLFEKHKDNIGLAVYFTFRPKISTAINDKLIGSTFFRSFREIHEIVAFFDSVGWKIKGTSLQNELKKHPQVRIE